MIFFTVPGNQEDPHGNPVGYIRTTQREKFISAKARRYNAWKDYVWVCLKKEYPEPPRFDDDRKIVVSCYMEFVKGKRPDPGNVVKGIADALSDRQYRSAHGILKEPRLYVNDRNVLERAMDFSYSENPGVLVIVSEG